MQFSTEKTLPTTTETLLVFCPQGAAPTLPDADLQALAQSVMDLGDFSGKQGETIALYPAGHAHLKRLVLAGAGDPQDAENPLEAVRAAVAAGVKVIQKFDAVCIALDTLASFDTVSASERTREATLMAILCGYSYEAKKKPTEDDEPATRLASITYWTEADNLDDAIHAGQGLGEAVNAACDLVNQPPDVCTPTHLAATASRIGEASGLHIDILDQPQLEELGMGAMLAVSRGATTPPKFIIMEHNRDHADDYQTVVLVGKGITFDTGGYSIKSKSGMVGMKGDMAGGAAVIGAMQAIAHLGLPVHVVGLVPTAANMINGDAYLPNEVVTASDGTTIEIISTDAEGRLLLADALIYAQRYQPDATIDLATLTGSIRLALGTHAAGLFCDNAALRDSLLAAADQTGERLWHMPMYKEFKEPLKTMAADTKNSGGRGGGASIAAVFLQQFTGEMTWAHLDIASTSEDRTSKAPYEPKQGANGYGVRLLVQYVEALAGA